MSLSPEELLAGGRLTHRVEIPGEVLRPVAGNGEAPASDGDGRAEDAGAGGEATEDSVVLRPLTVEDLQTISRAARERDELTGALMVGQALVEPELSLAEVRELPVGLLEFLLEEVNRISGVTASTERVAEVADAPLSRAAFVLSREFGWTPEEVSQLTLGQILLHLEMLEAEGRG